MMKSRARSSSPKRAANHPWYYVPRNPYATEQRLSAKHESDNRKQMQNEKINNYFNKCNQETKLLSNWNQNKHLVRYRKVENEPPFYVEDEVRIKIDEKIHKDYMEKICKHLDEYRSAALEFKKNFIDSSEAINYLLQQIEAYEDVKKNRDDFFIHWKRYLNSQSYNYANDPLRQVCFRIRDMLQFYRSYLYDNLQKLEEKIFKIELLNEAEQKELREYNRRCLKIMDVYLRLNEMRDKHFQVMFYEERETNWFKLKPIWQKEIEIWDNLFVKLFDANYSTIRKRIDQILEKQRAALKTRVDKLDKLKDLIEDCKHDEKLKPMLYYDIEQFKSSSSSC